MVQRTLAPRRAGSPPSTAGSKAVGSTPASPSVESGLPTAERPSRRERRALRNGMAENSLAENAAPQNVASKAGPRRPHFLDRGTQPVSATSSYGSPVKIHTDDWMQVELPRTDYVQAGLVALGIATIVSGVTLLPAIVFFNWLAVASASLWAKSVAVLPIACGLLGAWSCLRRAKSERIRDRLLDELRN